MAEKVFSAFLSYNRADASIVEALRGHLVVSGLAVFLDRENLTPGMPWPEALETALQASSGVIVVLGATGLGPWQKREVFFAIDRQVHEEAEGRYFPVIPVILPGASIVPSFLFQNSWIEVASDRHLDETALALVRSLEKRVGPQRDSSEVCPFRGLRPFREEHSAFFYGREKEVQALTQKVTHQRMICVVGQSGSGKSSVVLAGLIPELRRQRPPNTTWDIAVFTPGAYPWRGLAEALDLLISPEEESGDHRETTRTLAEDLEKGGGALQNAVQAVLRSSGADKLLLVVDQLEELFTLVTAKEAGSFIDALLNAILSSPLHVVFTLRADFYSSAIGASRRLSDELMAGQINVGSMTRDDLFRSITIPAEKVRLRFEPGLVDALLDSVEDQPGRLPLLQYALTNLWNARQDGLLTHAAFRLSGGVDRSIATRCDSILASMSDQERKATRNLFGQLVHLDGPDEGAPLTRRRARRDRLSAASWAVVQRFAGPENRLLVIEHRTDREPNEGPAALGEADFGQDLVDVSHEALITHWAVMREWLREDREFLLWQRQLEVFQSAWESSSPPDVSALLRGKSLIEANRWVRLKGDALSDSEKAFIAASTRRSYWARAISVTLLLFLIGTVAGGIFWGLPRWSRERALAALKADGVDVTQVEDGLRAVLYSETKLNGEVWSSLGDLPDLRELDLSETVVSDVDLSHLGSLRGLRELNLADTSVTDSGLDHVVEVRSLRSLSLGSCRGLTSTGFIKLERASGLHTLTLDDTRFGDADFAALSNMSQLEVLSLDGTAVSDRGLAALRYTPSIKRLWLQRTSITDGALRHVGDLRSLSALFLEETKVNGSGLRFLVHLDSLRELYLRSTRVDDAAAVHLASLRKLHYLDVSRTKITDSTLGQIAALPELTILWVIGNAGVTDAGAKAIAKMPALRQLFMGATSVGDAGLLALARMKPLRTLWVVSNPITESGLRKAVGAGTALQELNVYDTSISDQLVQGLNSRGGVKILKRQP